MPLTTKSMCQEVSSGSKRSSDRHHDRFKSMDGDNLDDGPQTITVSVGSKANEEINVVGNLEGFEAGGTYTMLVLGCLHW